MTTGSISVRIALITLYVLFACTSASAQHPLSKVVSVSAGRQPVKQVLQSLSDQGNFYFSYNSDIVPEDSLVTCHVTDTTVRHILELLFKDRYQYKESGNYIIIQDGVAGSFYTVCGYITDAATGERVRDASVYERQQLAVTFTDQQGFFRLRLKNRSGSIAVSVSKMDYGDTSVRIKPGLNQELRVAIQPAPVALKGVTIPARMERSWLSELFLSSRQKKQSRNLRRFFASKPYQLSLIPGLSTRGKLNSQVINHFSLNLVGGYTAGSKGFEIGGLFNINQRSTRYVQLAGGLNVTEGSATGIQLSVLHNFVMDSLRGVQVSAFTNKVETDAAGVQIGGVYNYAKRLKGVQIGLVNKRDSAGGVSIGLLNFVRGGYRKIAFSVNDLTNSNISFITGTHQLYTILTAGANIAGSGKVYTFGGGLGHDLLPGKRVSFSTSFQYQFVKLLTWDNRLMQLKGSINVALRPGLRLYAGPVQNWYTNNDGPWEGYKNIVSPEEYYAGYPSRKARKNWVGWEAGLAFETAGVTGKTARRVPRGWRLNAGLEGGYAFDDPFGPVMGAAIQLQKDVDSNISAVLATGYTHFSPTKENLYYQQAYDYFPLKAGLKIFAGRQLYFGAAAGIAWEVNAIQGTSFIWSPSLGWAFPSGPDISLKMEDFTKAKAIKQIGLSIVYGFGL